MNETNATQTSNTLRLLQLVKTEQWRKAESRCKIASDAEYMEKDKTSFHRTALHLACSNKKTPSNVIASLLSHSSSHEAMTLEDAYNRYLPLHCALRYKASFTTISLLLQHSSRSILSAQDRQGWTCAHIACQFASDASIIEMLLKAAPYLRGARDRRDTTLLDLIVRRKDDISSVLRYLLQEYEFPKGTTCASNTSPLIYSNRTNWSPLHLAIWYDAPYETLRALIEAQPVALVQRTASAQTPLSLYWNSSRPIEPKLISLLLDPLSTILIKHIRGRSVGMIHLTLAFPQYIPGLLEFVLQHFPNDAKCRLPNNQLPLHIVASKCYRRMNTQDVLSTCRQIFQRYPDAIRHADDQGLIPFQLAARSSNLTISFELLRLAPDTLHKSDGA